MQLVSRNNLQHAERTDVVLVFLVQQRRSPDPVSQPAVRLQDPRAHSRRPASPNHPDPLWPDTLAIERPDFSAKSPLAEWQAVTLTLSLILLAIAAAYDPWRTVTLLTVCVSPVFFCVVILRAAALRHALQNPINCELPEPERTGTEWPIYSLLIPLYHETESAAGLAASLAALDWPRDRLDILFITEADDPETRAALEPVLDGLPARILTVPDGAPRTKPRALMYALQYARGAFVAVYDAEDDPEPDQLKHAYARLSAADQHVGCVQARLNVYNPHDSWFTRQFTIEYTSLFDALLPAFQAMRLPLPLGGTSNHFPRAVLDAVGGWDPYNVTEDADLGIRLARAGWRVEVIPSTTWEEAPQTFDAWFGQRKRWLKGWMQTLLVHTRHPVRLWRDLGPRAFLGFTLLMGAMCASALIHPWIYIFVAGAAASGAMTGSADAGGWMPVLFWAGLANLAAAYAVGILLAAVTLRRRGLNGLTISAVWIPVYWLAVSLAAYWALVQLVHAPYQWQKTAHSGRRPRARAAH